LSGRAFANVQSAFADDAERAFRFLIDEFGFNGPDRQVVVMPAVSFTAPPLRYRIGLDTDDRTVVTQVDKETGEDRLVAELGRLVWAAGIGSANQVSRNANTLHNLQKSLVSQAVFLRQLHPLMIGADSDSIMLKAGARRWRV
jgi:hypothetical protein